MIPLLFSISSSIFADQIIVRFDHRDTVKTFKIAGHPKAKKIKICSTPENSNISFYLKTRKFLKQDKSNCFEPRMPAKKLQNLLQRTEIDIAVYSSVRTDNNTYTVKVLLVADDNSELGSYSLTVLIRHQGQVRSDSILNVLNIMILVFVLVILLSLGFYFIRRYENPKYPIVRNLAFLMNPGEKIEIKKRNKKFSVELFSWQGTLTLFFRTDLSLKLGSLVNRQFKLEELPLKLAVSAYEVTIDKDSDDSGLTVLRVSLEIPTVTDSQIENQLG